MIPALLSAALLAVATAAAPTSPAEASPELQPLAWLAGSCWSGDLPRGGGRDTHCFKAVYEGRFIRDLHVVTEGPRPYSGESLYRWDATGGAIRYAYFASDGGYSEGQVIPSGETLTFPDEYVSPAGERLEIRSLWTRAGPDSYRVVTERLNGGEWIEMWALVMTRSGPSTPDQDQFVRPTSTEP